jgi:hypothetical protein
MLVRIEHGEHEWAYHFADAVPVVGDVIELWYREPNGDISFELATVIMRKWKMFAGTVDQDDNEERQIELVLKVNPHGLFPLDCVADSEVWPADEIEDEASE